MKKSRFTESQIVAILKQHEAGVGVASSIRPSDSGCAITVCEEWGFPGITNGFTGSIPP